MMDVIATDDEVELHDPLCIREGRVRVYLLGTMRVVGSRGENLLPAPRKVQALLAYLCLAGESRTPRSRLATLFWGDSANEQASKSLRHALWQLSQVINRPPYNVLKVDRNTVWVDRAEFWIDISEFGGRGDQLLEGFDGLCTTFDHWLRDERDRLQDRERGTLEQTLQRLIEEGAAPELRASAARRLANFEPTHEGAIRALMAAFHEMAEPAQAIREFERLRRAMLEADLPISGQTAALHESIRLISTTRRGPKRSPSPYAGSMATGDQDRPLGEPSIAVLPFSGTSDAPYYDYAAAGVEDSLIEGLSRVPNLFVISRMSTLAFRRERRVPRELGKVLGVQYVVSGQLGIFGDHIGLATELSDTTVERPIWSCTIEERHFDWSEINERLMRSLTRRVAPWGAAHDIKAGRPNHPEAYDLFLRAQENMHNSSPVVFATCEELLNAAIALDPNYAPALAWRARWHLLRIAQGWSADQRQDAEQAEQFASRAVRCDETEPMTLAVYAYLAAYLHKNFDLALRRFEMALSVNPNSAPAWFWSATVRTWLGEGRRGVEHINRALTLSPFDPLIHAYDTTAALAYLVDSQFERAIEYGLRAVRENRAHMAGYLALAMSFGLAGYRAKAEEIACEILKLNPAFTVQLFRERSPSCAGPMAELFCDALARAGIPLSA